MFANFVNQFIILVFLNPPIKYPCASCLHYNCTIIRRCLVLTAEGFTIRNTRKRGYYSYKKTNPTKISLNNLPTCYTGSRFAYLSDVWRASRTINYLVYLGVRLLGLFRCLCRLPLSLLGEYIYIEYLAWHLVTLLFSSSLLCFTVKFPC